MAGKRYCLLTTSYLLDTFITHYTKLCQACIYKKRMIYNIQGVSSYQIIFDERIRSIFFDVENVVWQWNDFF